MIELGTQNIATDNSGVTSGAQGFSGLPNYIDAILNQTSSHYWNYGSFGAGVTVTYNFPNWYYTNPNEGPAYTFTASEQNYARQAIALWSDVANVNFVEVSASGTADIEIRKVFLSNAAGGTYYPHTVISGVEFGGSIYLDPSYSPAAPGTYNFLTIVHELGHALGLKHPGNYNAGGGGTEGPYLPSSEDNHSHTVMSYYDASGLSGVNALTPMIDDIAAIQYVYGARQSHLADDSYSFSTSTQLKTIWDAGGNDTFDASNQTTSCFINLNPGTFSSVGTGGAQLNNIGIAYNCYIENAVGGSAADVIYGNSLANTISGGAGGDYLDGQGGFDRLSFANDPAGVVANFDTHSGIDGYGGSDHYYNFENLLGSAFNDVLYGSNAIDVLEGNNGNDLINALGGDDLVIGGAGADTMFGGSGFNTISYGGDPAGVQVNLGTGTGIDGWGYAETFAEFRKVIGSIFGDVIFGDSQNNNLDASSGNDLVYGGGGSNTLDGGSGFDTLTFAYDPNGVQVNLGTHTGINGFGGSDLYFNFEQVVGSARDDVLFGDDGINVLSGGDGNDYIAAQGGDDLIFSGSGRDNMDGGAGFNTLSFESDPSGVQVNLGTGTGLDGWGDADRFTNFRKVIGSNFNDVIFGGSDNEVLSGGGGNDLIRGQGGNDFLTGGAGNNTFVFADGDGRDTISDFTASTSNVLDLSQVAGLNNYSDVHNHMAQVGSDVLITLNGGDTVDLQGVTISFLDSHQGMFVV